MGTSSLAAPDTQRKGWWREEKTGGLEETCVSPVIACLGDPREWVTDDWQCFLEKEVIQPQGPLRLPCYDLVPIAEFIFGACLLAVGAATSDAPHFRGLTGGVYKAQEHIHRGMLTRDY